MCTMHAWARLHAAVRLAWKNSSVALAMSPTRSPADSPSGPLRASLRAATSEYTSLVLLALSRHTVRTLSWSLETFWAK